MPRGGTSSLYRDPVILDGELLEESPKYMTDLWTERGIDFIEQNKDGEQPFFLFLSYNGPYCLSRLLLRPAKNRWAEYYADKPMLSFPRDSAHPWQYSNLDYHNNIVSMRRVAAEVSGVDDGVGQIFETLREHGLDENTLVVFAGDQGWMGGHNGFFGMGDHTRPMAAHDMMMHVPLLFWHPEGIQPGKSEAMVTNNDFLPSVLEYVGLEKRIPQKPRLPGRSYAPILRGEKIDWPTEMYYEMESCRSLRTEKWKYVERRSPSGPGELYDMEQDPMERFNLFGQAGYEEVQARLAAQLLKILRYLRRSGVRHLERRSLQGASSSCAQGSPRLPRAEAKTLAADGGEGRVCGVRQNPLKKRPGGFLHRAALFFVIGEGGRISLRCHHPSCRRHPRPGPDRCRRRPRRGHGHCRHHPRPDRDHRSAMDRRRAMDHPCLRYCRRSQ